MENTIMNTLVGLDEAKRLVATGAPLMFAADAKLLAQLPRGRWMGGTIPYFMAAQGGRKTAEQLFVTGLPDYAAEAEVRLYPPDALPRIPADYPVNGVSFIILPASSRAHADFAEHGPSWPGLFDRPLVGWISGVDLADLGKVAPRVFDGVSGESSDNAAVVMHVKLPPGRTASVDIINLFTPGAGDALTFPADGFETTEVLVNGERRGFAEYLAAKAADPALPLVADYHGAMVNISFQTVDQASKRVSFYAPVFAGVTYRLARPLAMDYASAFQRELVARAVSPVFACNCILNYLHGGLEGKQLGGMVGPITFGEVAYMLLNQTMVYVTFV
jgi:hypothetical protein